MVILEDCGEITFTEARIKEEEYRVKLNANMNMIKCHQTEEEEKERHRKQAREYKENNKDKIKEYQKEYDKEYREKNKEKIKEHKFQLCTCECGRTYTNLNKARHERTLIHKKLIEEKNNI